MKTIDAKLKTYLDFGIGNNDTNPNIEVDDHVKILKYKNIFAKFYTPDQSKKDFFINKFKVLCTWMYTIKHLTGEENVKIVKSFMKKESKNILNRLFELKR